MRSEMTEHMTLKTFETENAEAPLGLDQWEEERVLVLQNPDGLFLAMPLVFGGPFFLIVAHEDDEVALRRWWSRFRYVDSPREIVRINLGEGFARIRARGGLTVQGCVAGGVWFPISGEVIPL